MYKNGKNIIIIDRNVNCVDAILNDARKTKPLSNEEEHQVWQLMQQGSQRARTRLIESNIRDEAHCIVMGIKRGEEYLMNPEPQEVLEQDDIVNDINFPQLAIY